MHSPGRAASKKRMLARTAKEVKQYSLWMKALTFGLGTIVLLTSIVYIFSILYDRYGSFTVTINKFDSVKQTLSLSETPDFIKSTSRLNAKASRDITNIDGDLEIPKDVNQINGEHNGENYIAYTFYVKNVGTESLNFVYKLYIMNVENNVDRAVRIRLYVDDEYETYARTRTDGTGPEPGTIEFLTSSIITQKQINDFAPNDIRKFTVVIWLEGNDPDCTDDLIGGQLKIDMSISVVD